jgi:hypothetical protein
MEHDAKMLGQGRGLQIDAWRLPLVILNNDIHHF